MRLGVGSLVDKIHELIEFGSDYDLRAAVALTSDFSIVIGHWIVFATATGCETRGIHSEIILEHLDHRGRTQTAQIPVVTDVGARDRHIVSRSEEHTSELQSPR